MSVATAPAGVGDLLRDWRHRRRRSQLDLALDASVSSRHLSFVETGRSKPSRDLVLHLAEHLEVPLRERNALLLAAGYAPVYSERSLDDATMGPVNEALETILTGHEPFPAIIVDRAWNLVSANRPAVALMTDGVDPALLSPPINTMRVALHPDGMAPRIVNLREWGAHLLTRLNRQLAMAPDAEVEALRDELLTYPGIEEEDASMAVEAAAMLFHPLRVSAFDTELTCFSTLATFGTPLDVTLAELSIESFFPADSQTEAALRGAYGG